MSLSQPDDEDIDESDSEEDSFPSAVPVSRTSGMAQPLVFPSSFNTPNVAAVVPIESLSNTRNNAFPYGPRALNVQQVRPHTLDVVCTGCPVRSATTFC